MKTMTRSIGAQITADWQHEFPALGIVERRHLLRRVGPILEGIALETGSDRTVYQPIFHVHCLAREHPSITLTLSHPLLTRVTSK